MRLCVRSFFAFVSAAAVVASTQPAVAADPAPAATSTSQAVCPHTTVFSSRDGKTYVAAFDDGDTYAGTVSATFYTATQSFVARIPIAIEKPAAHSGFRSLAVSIVDPSAEPFDAVEFDFGGIAATGPCIDRFRVAPFSPTDADVKAAYAELDPAQIPIALLQVIGEISTLTCKRPYASAQIDGVPAQPVYPAMAQANHVTGVVSIKVTLAPSGAVTDAEIFHSSGSDLLDRSGLQAARATRYRAQTFRCMPVAGSYLYQASFSAS